MAIFDSQKVDYLWKKLGYGRTKTDINSIKNATNESIASPLLIRGDLVWSEADQIPTVLPGTTGGVVQVYPTSSPVECVADITASPNRTWKTNSIDWIPPEIGDTYQIKVYVHTSGQAVNAAASGTQLFSAGSGNNDEWFFDYQSGTLNFIGENLPNGVNFSGKSVYISGARYTGIKGVAPGAGGAGQFNALEVSSLNITGVSTFSGALDINADIDVSGFTELDSVNIAELLNVAGIATFSSLVDINSNLDVDGFTELDSVNISENLNVVGLTTLSLAVDINSDLDVDGRTELDDVNIDNTLNVVGLSTFASDVDINSSVTISSNLDVDGFTELDDVNIANTLYVVGVSTFASALDINSDLDVTGHTELDNVNVSGVVTATSFHTGLEGSSIRVTSDSITGPSTITIDPAGVGDNTGLVIIKGDLQVDGTQTIINSTVVSVDDLNIVLADGAANDAAADGGGITVQSGEGNKTFQFEATGDNFGSSENINLATGKTYKIANTEVLSSTQLTIENIDSSGISTIATIDVSTGTVDNLTSTNINNLGIATFLNAEVSGTLDVDGFTELDDVNIANTLNVVGVSTFSSNIDANANVEIAGSLDVDGRTELDDVNIANTLNVSGVSTFASAVDINSDVDISGYLDVVGHTELNTVVASGIVTTSALLDINAGAQANSFKVEDLTDNHIVLAGVGGELEGDSNLTFDGSLLSVGVNLDVDGFTELDDVNIANTLNVVGVTTFASAVHVNTTIDVDGLADFDDVNVGAAITVAGNTDLNGDLDVDGRTELDDVNIDNTLNVVGIATFGSGIDINGLTELIDVNVSSAITVTGSADLNGDLDVDGRTELDDVNIDNTLNVTGVATFLNHVNVGGALSVTGNSFFVGMVTFAGGEDGNIVLGNANTDNVIFNADVNSSIIPQVDDQYDLGSSGQQWRNLYLDGRAELDDVNIENTLNVSGVSTFASAVDINSNVDISGYLDVVGHTELDNVNVSGVSTFTGNSEFGGDIVVDGLADLDDVNVSAAITVTGATDLDGGLDVTGHTELDDLNVSGVSTFAGAVNFSDIDISGHTELDSLNVSGIATIGNVVVGGATTDLLVNGDARITGFLDIGTASIRFDGSNNQINVGSALTLASTDGIQYYDQSLTQYGFDVNNVNVGSAITVTGSTDLNGDLDVAGHTDVADLGVSGVSTFVGAIDADSHLDVAGQTTLNTLNVIGFSTFLGVSTFIGDLYVTGNVEVLGSLGGDLNSGGISTFTDLVIEGGISVIGLSSLSNLEVSGVSTFIGNADFDGPRVDVAGLLNVDGHTFLNNVNISGVTTIAQDLNVTRNFEVTGLSTFTGNIDANADLDVSGLSNLDHTIVDGNLNVTGLSTFTGNTKFQGNVDILGVLTYEDVTNVDSVGIATARVGLDVLSGGINVTGVSTFNNTVNFVSSIDIDGHTELDNLNVSGVSTFASAVDINSDVDISGYLDVVGHTELNTVVASGIVTASKFDGDLNALGKTYYVATTGSDSNSGNNINEPYLTIAQALSVATNGDIINVSAGVYEETCPLVVPRGVTVKGAGLRATTIRPTTATKQENVFHLNDISTVEDFTIRGSYFDTSADTGYAFAYAPGIAITTRSPYIQRVTVLNTGSTVTADDPYGYDSADSNPTSYIAGAGAKVDGSLVASNSLEAGMLFNEVTFFTPNSKGTVLTNGARAEYLNCFHYFASQAIVGIAGTTGIAGTAGARLKLNNPGVTPVTNDVIKLFDGGVGIATGTVTAYSNDYATIDGLGIGTFTSVGAGTTQDVRIYENDGVTLRGYADQITLADYTMFGAEMRSVGCAVEYGSQGVVADGNGVKLRLFATNFNFVGSGKDFTNDSTLANQSNEVIELNGGDVSYVSIDQDGDFRVGDALYINQQTGNVAFAATEYNLEVTGNLDVTDGSNTSTLSPTSLSVGSLTLSGNTLASTSGNIIIDPSGTNKTIIQGDLGVVGILTASVINVDAFQKGNTSVSITDTGSNGTIIFSTEGSEAFRIDNIQRSIFSGDVSIGSSILVSGISTFTGIGTFQSDLYVAGKLDVDGSTELDNLVVSGVTTFLSPANFSSGINDLNVVGVATIGNVVIGGGTTDLVVNGDARITGILTVGASSLTLDGDQNTVQVGAALTLGHTIGLQYHTQSLHASGFEVNNVNVGVALTVAGPTNLADVSVTGNLTGNVIGDLTGDVYAGIVTATSGFVGDVTGNLTGDVYAGIVTATSGFTGDLTGNVSGTSVVATGIITASGFEGTSVVATGIITASSFDGTVYATGSGEALHGTHVGPISWNAADPSGDFILTPGDGSTVAAAFTGNVTGNLSGTSVVATGIITASSFDGTVYATGSGEALYGTHVGKISYNSLDPTTGIILDPGDGLVAAAFTGNVTGDVLDASANVIVDISNGDVNVNKVYAVGIGGASTGQVLTTYLVATAISWNALDPTDTSSHILTVGDEFTQATYYGDVVDSNGNVVLDISSKTFIGTATTATNLEDAANITTGTIDDARLPDLITSNINVTSGVSTFSSIQTTNVTSSYYDTDHTRDGSSILATNALTPFSALDLDASTFRSVELLIQSSDVTNMHLTKLLVIHDGITAYLTEYGTVYNIAPLATFDAVISGGFLQLIVTPANATPTEFKVSYTAIRI